uniref:Peptidase C14 caspase domain-containing protein n=2 Tax=Manihot esculenta TaxID=3983 RepID=A0A2C9VK54_MANES
MMEALGFRQTKWKRLGWNTNVTAIQRSPTLDKTCQIPRDERSNISNITPNSKDDKKPAAYDNDREKSKLNPELAICRGCLQGLSTTIPCDQSLGEKPTNSSLNCKPSPLFLSPSGIRGPRKRALLVGVTYKNRKYKLKGTVNNVKNMRDFLIDSFFFKPENILVLTEDETEPYLTPTKKNIETSLKWLVKDCQVGDSLVFYFSGHGLRQPDFNSDELDGFDETICPVDFIKEGMIIDNYINSTIVWPLPKGVTLHAIVDASNSSTLDLVNVYDKEK